MLEEELVKQQRVFLYNSTGSASAGVFQGAIDAMNKH